MRHYFTKTIFLVLLLCAATAHALDTAQTRQLLELVGFDKEVAANARSMREIQPNVQGSDAEFLKTWAKVAKSIYQEDVIFDALVLATAPEFTQEDHDFLTDYFSKGFGRKVTDLENDSYENNTRSERESEGNEVLANLLKTNPQRVVLYKEMLDVLGGVESSLAAIINYRYALYAGMASSGVMPGNPTDEQLLRLAQQDLKAVRQTIIDASMRTMAFTYQSLDYFEVEEYIGFLSSGPGHKMYRVIGEAGRALDQSLAQKFGHDLMVMSGVREL